MTEPNTEARRQLVAELHRHREMLENYRVHDLNDPAWLSEVEDLLFQAAAALSGVSRDEGLEKVIVPRTRTPRKGQCPIRPPLDGTKGNPMVWCQLKAKHKGLHSWELAEPSEGSRP